MEKDDLIELFEIFKKELRSNNFAQEFFVSLSEGVFYQIDKDRIFSFGHIPLMSLSKSLSEYRDKELFEGDDKYDFIRYYKIGKRWPDSIVIKDNFIILENCKESLEYIKSLSRDNKINNIIK